MVDQVKKLLLNRSGVPGMRKVSDAPSDAVMSLFGVTGADSDYDSDADVVERLLPLALAPDLVAFRRFYDGRTTPVAEASVYRTAKDGLSPDGIYGRILGRDGWWKVSALFQHDDPAVYAVLADMRDGVSGKDAAYALGAVLLAVAYRRWILQGGGD
jgi:hypothetical protein